VVRPSARPIDEHHRRSCIAAERFNSNSICARRMPRAILAEHYAKSATELNTARLRMARIPRLMATLIDNEPAVRHAGFKL